MFHMEHTVIRRASVAGEIRAEMARRQMSVTALSAGSGIKVDTLRRRLAGHRPFNTDELDSITHFLDLPLITLVQRAAANNG